MTGAQFWCASYRRHRPQEVLGGKVDKFRLYCRDCLARRQQAIEAISRRRAEAGGKPPP